MLEWHSGRTRPFLRVKEMEESMSSLIANALPPGGTIGIVAPASPYNRPSDLLRGVAWWEARGYHVKLASGIHERTNWTAGSPETRARDLMAFFTDPEVDVIQCLRGGVGSAEVVPLLDYDAIAAHPKPFIGFSDITALHTALWRRAGLVTFYGPSLTLVATWSSFTTDHMLRMLGGQTTGPIPRDPGDPWVRAIAPGVSSGRVVGGCLSDLLATMGTPWELDLDDAIFVFEEVGDSPHGLERKLVQLEQAGKLAGVRGVAVGDLTGGEFDEGGGSPFPHSKTLEQVLEDRLRPLGVPVLYPLPVGHGGRLATIPLGVRATVDASACELVITEPALALARG
jgi:muramoyltetrapeptide carboxypeptidase